MKRLLFGVLLALVATLAHAQQGLVGPYQYMHITYTATEIAFLPAFDGKESIKVADVREEGSDKRRAPLELMSKVLTQVSNEGWDVVSAVPLTSTAAGTGGFSGMIYVLRKPRIR
ncbi:hypothetical protein [Hymenobacter persicinus]|uniref:DUF4177 domain-containing protein n=1 Tax=Hymenobacter persicinus TaxID=2025506 RepID=A0A4Q5LA97_9BACT|nr:hypothetical protein [Hymenobacter persicinus]RYU78792.1 hypothetical protein EWM57_12745 [Hymenobacter persicinus]